MALSFRARRDLMAAGGALLLSILLFPGALLQGELFFERDLHLDWYPRLDAIASGVRDGAWPLWDTSIGFGQPLLADPGAQVLYPVNWVVLAVPRPVAYTVFALLHLLIAAVGMSRLAGKLGAGRLGALVAAAVFVVSGPLQSSLNLWHHFAGLTWAPWVLLAMDDCSRRPARGRLLRLAALAAVQILAGSADVCAMTWAVAAVWAGFRLLERRRGRLVRGVATLAVAGLLSAGLSAAVWWPAADVLSRSPRQELPEDIRTAWSVPPHGLWRFVAPLDPPRVPFSVETWTALYGRPQPPFLGSLYLGLIALTLAAAALISRRSRRMALLLTSLSLAGVLFTMGPHGGFYTAATELVPLLKVFRYPSKAALLVAVTVALVSGLGTGALVRRRLSSRSLAGLGAGLLVGVSAVALVGASWWGSLSPAASAALAVVAAVILALAAGGRLRPPLAALALACLAVGDLVLAHADTNATAPPALVFEAPSAVARVDRDERRRLYVYDYHALPDTAERLLGRASPYPVGPPPPGWGPRQLQVAAQRQYLLPPSGGLFGLEGSYDLDLRGLYPRALNDLTFFLRRVEGTTAHTRLLRMGAVGTVLSLHHRGLEDLRPDGTVPSLFPEAIRVWRVPGVLPRSWVVGGARIADERAAFETLAGPSFEPADEVLLPEGETRDPPEGFVGTSRVLRLAADRVTLEVEASDPGFVVLADAFDPGWGAAVDGRPAPVLRANVAFRAVPVPEGRHVVEMAYRPPAVGQGLMLSAASLLLLLGAAVSGARGRPRGPGR